MVLPTRHAATVALLHWRPTCRFVTLTTPRYGVGKVSTQCECLSTHHTDLTITLESGRLDFTQYR